MSTHNDGYDGAQCSCGSTWFDLAPENDDDVCGFTLDNRGVVITGYCGLPICVECGTPWTPPRERLRVVPTERP